MEMGSYVEEIGVYYVGWRLVAELGRRVAKFDGDGWLLLSWGDGLLSWMEMGG
jgi:hypothetical protein